MKIIRNVLIVLYASLVVLLFVPIWILSRALCCSFLRGEKLYWHDRFYGDKVIWLISKPIEKIFG